MQTKRSETIQMITAVPHERKDYAYVLMVLGIKRLESPSWQQRILKQMNASMTIEIPLWLESAQPKFQNREKINGAAADTGERHTNCDQWVQMKTHQVESQLMPSISDWNKLKQFWSCIG
jgi:hypothetical protein